MAFPMATGPGRLVGGRYRLKASLGRGGMGEVWHAHDDLLGRDVAVKEVLQPLGLSAGDQQLLVKRTVREARAAARLSHPAAVTVFDVIEEDGRPWIVMEFVRSRSLAQAVKEDGPLQPRQAARVGLQVLGALTAAHAAGILHRDVKPANVLLGADGRVVLTDFGIATLEGDAALTMPSAVIGSPAYIAPERTRGGPAEPASDLWSLGVTLYAAVEGRTPYERGGMVPTLVAVASEEPDPPRQAGPLVPVLEGLLRRDPAERLSAAETRRLLGGLVARHGADIRPQLPRPEPPTRPEPRLSPDSGAWSRVVALPARTPDAPAVAPFPVPPLTIPPLPVLPRPVPAGSGQPPIPAAEGLDDPGRKAPRRLPLAALPAVAGLAAVGLIAIYLLLPGHPASTRPGTPATSSGAAGSVSGGAFAGFPAPSAAPARAASPVDRAPPSSTTGTPAAGVPHARPDPSPQRPGHGAPSPEPTSKEHKKHKKPKKPKKS
jgi:eukaryotic-like serine/threonine-protein kinase